MLPVNECFVDRYVFALAANSRSVHNPLGNPRETNIYLPDANELVVILL